MSRSSSLFDGTSTINTEQMSSLNSISAVEVSRSLKFDGTTLSNTNPISSLNGISAVNIGGSLHMPSSTSALNPTKCGRPCEHLRRELTLRYDVLTSSNTRIQVGKRLQIGWFDLGNDSTYWLVLCCLCYPHDLAHFATAITR